MNKMVCNIDSPMKLSRLWTIRGNQFQHFSKLVQIHLLVFRSDKCYRRNRKYTCLKIYCTCTQIGMFQWQYSSFASLSIRYCLPSIQGHRTLITTVDINKVGAFRSGCDSALILNQVACTYNVHVVMLVSYIDFERCCSKKGFFKVIWFRSVLKFKLHLESTTLSQKCPIQPFKLYNCISNWPEAAWRVHV